MTSKFPAIIVIQLRYPRNQEERNCFGITYSTRGKAEIFVNSRKNITEKELRDTLMHECYHAIVGMFKLSTKHEEKIARRVGRLVR